MKWSILSGSVLAMAGLPNNALQRMKPATFGGLMRGLRKRVSALSFNVRPQINYDAS
jgi:hypothetical protein